MKFRKKPVVIDAVKWNGHAEDALKLEDMGWTGPMMINGAIGELEIPTLEGIMLAVPGDWIIKGVKGEFYPCKPDIFEMTYERA